MKNNAAPHCETLRYETPRLERETGFEPATARLGSMHPFGPCCQLCRQKVAKLIQLFGIERGRHPVDSNNRARQDEC